jgi:hypothetical protein
MASIECRIIIIIMRIIAGKPARIAIEGKSNILWDRALEQLD